MKMPLPHFTADTYTFAWLDDQIDVELDGVREARGGELRAMLTVHSERTGSRELLHQSDFNLNGPRARADVVRALAQRVAITDFDWPVAIEQICFASRKRWQEGEPLIYLPDYQPVIRERFLLSPFQEFSGPTVLFARGGSGKSLFGLALALSIGADVNAVCGLPAEQRRVAYLDWETEPDTHHERLQALCAGANVPFCEAGIWYRRQSASLAESAGHLRRLFVKEKIGMAIIDSLGMARGGEPESADTTIRLFAAARTLGVPILAIDHMTKNGGTDQQSPFGSVYTENAARMTWALEKVEDNGAGLVTIALSNRKTNNGIGLGRRAYDVTFRSSADGRLDSVTYDSRDVRDVAVLRERLSMAQQIVPVLTANGWLTVKRIAELLNEEGIEAKESAITNALARGGRLFLKRDGYAPAMWGVKENASFI